MKTQHQLPSLTELEWAHNRTNELWDEVVKRKEIPFEIWVGMFANIMGRLLQGTAQDEDDAVEIANDMLLTASAIIEFAANERFGLQLKKTSWQQ